MTATAVRPAPAPGGFRPAMPFHMVWLATDGCNARCLHCSSNSTRRSPGELTTDEARDLMTQLARAGVVDLAVSGGEPLLRRDLFDVVAHARALGLSVGIGSNGGRLTPRQAVRLAASGINRFQVSLDGLREQHDRLRRWPGLFDRVQRTIDTVAGSGVRVHVCCTITQLNVDDLEEFVAYVATRPVRRINFSRYVPTGRGTALLDIGDARWREVAERCMALRDAYAGRLEITTHLAQQILVDPCVAGLPGFVGCQAARGQGAVTATGDVLPCVLLPVPMGNIRQRPFAEIWRDSPVAARLRDRASLSGACGSCALRERCGGCRAVAYARTGDYLAPDPRCWLPDHETHG
ncbi:heme d1 biosynthesis radical SAM protein NirJ2 [Actinoplanes sp. NBRC 14428]|nr:heme d1 biosynthesis radical SAM protein NirJ2 [Actinoplanes sp. NBRC 14428]